MLQLYFHFFLLSRCRLSHSMSIFGMFSSSSHPCFSLQVIMRPIFRVLINPKWLSQCNKLGCVIMTCSDVVSFIHPSPPVFSVFASASSKFMFIIISVFRCFQTRAERRQRGTITPRSVPPFSEVVPLSDIHVANELGEEKRGQQNIALRLIVSRWERC